MLVLADYHYNNGIKKRKEECHLTVKRRIRSIRLSERINRQSEYSKFIGVAVEMKGGRTGQWTNSTEEMEYKLKGGY